MKMTKWQATPRTTDEESGARRERAWTEVEVGAEAILVPDKVVAKEEEYTLERAASLAGLTLVRKYEGETVPIPICRLRKCRVELKVEGSIIERREATRAGRFGDPARAEAVEVVMEIERADGTPSSRRINSDVAFIAEHDAPCYDVYPVLGQGHGIDAGELAERIIDAYFWVIEDWDSDQPETQLEAAESDAWTNANAAISGSAHAAVERIRHEAGRHLCVWLKPGDSADITIRPHAESGVPCVEEVRIAKAQAA